MRVEQSRFWYCLQNRVRQHGNASKVDDGNAGLEFGSASGIGQSSEMRVPVEQGLGMHVEQRTQSLGDASRVGMLAKYILTILFEGHLSMFEGQFRFQLSMQAQTSDWFLCNTIIIFTCNTKQNYNEIRFTCSYADHQMQSKPQCQKWVELVPTVYSLLTSCVLVVYLSPIQFVLPMYQLPTRIRTKWYYMLAMKVLGT